MLGFLEHSFSIAKDSPIHQAAQACYSTHFQSESFKEVFSSFPWIKDLMLFPEKYHIANGGSETTKQYWLHHKNSLSCECVLINGKYEPSLSQLPEGVLAMSLKEAQSVFSTFIQRYAVDTQPLAFLNSVCAQDEGVVIYVPEKFQVSETLFIRHICSSTSQDDRVIYSPKIILILGKRSCCRVLVSHHTERESGVAQSFAIVNGVTEVFVSEGAELTLTMEPKYINEERVSWTHIATIEELGACSIYQRLQEDVGGYGWFDNTFSMIGSNSHGESLVSALSPKKTWVRNFMHHDAESTTSRQTIKSILYSGHFLFEGSIHVTSRGVFTDAYQKHDTLLLSDQARVTTFPRLEILTDDVKASHGATVGPLDPQQIFYMQSRGMTREEAQKKLVQGFLSMGLSQDAFPKLSAQMRNQSITKEHSLDGM
ncbi:ABC transporter integral membrane protein [Chlamydia felis Fe/C-56]|uniref:ABC transporter integral membrane protein n=1 Tax=Chlamydia felis (strain Fe/C-56) TaxID=264202 RepID=Q252R4_CHLFF|nr:SufD family Fe-S cluster assembly protein [Chlamydia felis]BAE81724.1 ABC transporter integral membrane protein [Chlamydia felis Fe/C-56]